MTYTNTYIIFTLRKKPDRVLVVPATANCTQVCFCLEFSYRLRSSEGVYCGAASSRRLLPTVSLPLWPVPSPPQTREVCLLASLQLLCGTCPGHGGPWECQSWEIAQVFLWPQCCVSSLCILDGFLPDLVLVLCECPMTRGCLEKSRTWDPA